MGLPALKSGRLLELTVSQLIEVAQSIGLSYGGLRKAELIDSISSALKGSMSNEGQSIRYISSIDLGFRNFAHAHLQVNFSSSDKSNNKPRLLCWESVDLDLADSFDPRQFVQHMDRCFHRLFEPIKSRKDSTLFLVERQSFRGGGLRMIPGPIIMVNRIETALHHHLLMDQVQAIDPRQISHSMQWSKKEASLKRSNREKKIQSISTVDNYCKNSNDSPVIIPNDLREKYLSMRKRDDLADALIQAVVYLQWQYQMFQLTKSLYSVS